MSGIEEEFNYFKQLLNQLHSNNEKEVNNANGELNVLFSTNKIKCLLFAARTIIEDPNNEQLVIISLSFIKKIATPTRLISESEIRSSWCAEENNEIRFSVRNAIFNSIMNLNPTIRNIAAAVLAYVIKIEKENWGDAFSFIMSIANEERGESGRLLVIKIFEELFNIDIFEEVQPGEVAGFYEMLNFTVRNDEKSQEEALKCFALMINKIPSFFISEMVPNILEVITHYIETDDIDIFVADVSLFIELLKAKREILSDFTNEFISIADAFLKHPGNEFLNVSCSIWVEIGYCNYTQEFVSKATPLILPTVLEAGKVVEDDYDYFGYEGLHNNIGFAINSFYHNCPEESFPIITNFFMENVNSEWNCKYAAFLSLCGFVATPCNDPNVFQFLNSILGYFSLVGTEEYPQLADSIISVLRLVIDSFPSLLSDESNNILCYQLITTCLAPGSKLNRRACELMNPIFEKGPKELVLARFDEYLSILMLAIDNNYIESDFILYPFYSLKSLISKAKKEQSGVLIPLLKHFIEKLNETSNPLLCKTELDSFNISNGYALCITCLIRKLGREIVPFTDDIMKSLFSMVNSISLIDEYFLQLKEICRVFKRKNDSREEFEAFQVFVPYIEPIMQQLVSSIKSGDPRQMCLASDAYGTFFDTALEVAVPYIGDEFQFMMEHINPEEEDPLNVVPAIIRGIGQLFCAMKYENSPEEEVYSYTQKLAGIVKFMPDKKSKSDIEYGNEIYMAVMIGMRGVIAATSQEIKHTNREFRKTINRMFVNLIKRLDYIEEYNASLPSEFYSLLCDLIEDMCSAVNVAFKNRAVHSFVSKAMIQFSGSKNIDILRSISETLVTERIVSI